jgi:hypothetical protein
VSVDRKRRSFVPAAALAGLLLIVGAIGLWRVHRWDIVDTHGLEPAAPRVERATSTGVPDPVDTSMSRGPPPAPKRVRELLEEYYGVPLEAFLRDHPEAGSDPSLLERETVLLPWEKVEPMVREDFTASDEVARRDREARWLCWPGGKVAPDYNDPRLNLGGKQLNNADRQALSDIEARYRATLEQKAAEAEALLSEAVARDFDAGRYSRSPLLRVEDGTPAPAGIPGHYHFGKHTNMGGWIVDFEFDSRNHPELEATLESIDEFRRQRMESVRRYIESIP